ncbi:hypothetical protein CY34DRAFT_805261 [Suillus luteus UH-Slu-Lm8-n1]|uniref:Uncharacterized protein n=1 Tax=Suillus luteus UH-Slu-Lm8-n1 TaxID=930992 RepID=A0A0D0BFR3_9AGAM|nr:hypothetical protein CY34DRAFT_805261 [Suillus luteus UH-Slu-Lm8-n1]
MATMSTAQVAGLKTRSTPEIFIFSPAKRMQRCDDGQRYLVLVTEGVLSQGQPISLIELTSGSGDSKDVPLNPVSLA